MLDMFKRPTDPPEYNAFYLGSGLAMVGATLLAYSAGIHNVYLMGYLASSVLCIGAIAGLAS